MEGNLIMKRFVIAVLLCVCFLIPIKAEAVLISSGNGIPFSNFVDIFLDDSDFTMANINAPSGKTLIKLNISTRGSSSGDPTSYRFFIYANGVEQFSTNIPTINTDMPLTSRPPVMMHNFSVALPENTTNVVVRVGGRRKAIHVMGTVEVSADVADNATVIQARDAANLAKTSADAAKTSADTAVINASNANTNASTAAARAQTAINQTWYSSAYGGASENVANLAGYIRMSQHYNKF